jgi:hypothetical protein
LTTRRTEQQNGERVRKGTQGKRRIKQAPSIPKAQRIDVTRAEFNRVIDMLNERGTILNDLRHNQDLQFQRIAQIQAQLDEIKRAWERMKVEP